MYQITSAKKNIAALNGTINDPDFFNTLYETDDCVVTQIPDLTPDQIAAQQAEDQKTAALPQNKFSLNKFAQDLMASSLSADSNVLQYYAVIKDLASFKNFAGMKAMVAGLLAAGKLTQTEVDQLNAVLANQSIVLSNF